WRDSELDRETVADGLEALARELEMEIKTRFTALARRQRMAMMVTKEPHCFRKLVEAIKSGRLKKAEPAPVPKRSRRYSTLPWTGTVNAGNSGSFVSMRISPVIGPGASLLSATCTWISKRSPRLERWDPSFITSRSVRAVTWKFFPPS